jgi:hypothetical protein
MLTFEIYRYDPLHHRLQSVQAGSRRDVNKISDREVSFLGNARWQSEGDVTSGFRN